MIVWHHILHVSSLYPAESFPSLRVGLPSAVCGCRCTAPREHMCSYRWQVSPAPENDRNTIHCATVTVPVRLESPHESPHWPIQPVLANHEFLAGSYLFTVSNYGLLFNPIGISWRFLASENYSPWPIVCCSIVCVILRLAVLVQCRLVTDGQTDVHTRDDSIYHTTTASRGNNAFAAKTDGWQRYKNSTRHKAATAN